MPFWEALQLPPDITPPAQRHQAGERSAGHPDTELDELARQLARALRDSGFFEDHGVHPWVDGWSLVIAPTRRPEAWADSEFAALLRPALRPTGSRSDRRTTHPPMSPSRPAGDNLGPFPT